METANVEDIWSWPREVHGFAKNRNGKESAGRSLVQEEKHAS
jgi:hypothetical protein